MCSTIRIKTKLADSIGSFISVNGIISAAVKTGLELHHISPVLCKDPYPRSEKYKRNTCKR